MYTVAVQEESMRFRSDSVAERIRLCREGLQIVRHWWRVGTDEMFWLTEAMGVAYGHFRSVRERRPVDGQGEPVPWYTYPALEYLRQFDFSAWDAFEFGGGNSSRFWARRCRSVTTVESDPTWHATIVKDALPSQTVLLETDPVRYADAVTRGDRRYHLIVIDGQHRRACTERAHRHLMPGGMILFDNTDWWPDSCAYLRAQGLMQVDFTGPGPSNQYMWTTSMFFREHVALVSSTGRQPHYGIGSLHHYGEETG
jgi:hypothetical protein